MVFGPSLPHKPGQFFLPYELQERHALCERFLEKNVPYFRLFGCKRFFQIKGVCLSKFDPKALEGILFCYGAKSRTYRIFYKASEIVIETSSVQFDKNVDFQVV